MVTAIKCLVGIFFFGKYAEILINPKNILLNLNLYDKIGCNDRLYGKLGPYRNEV